MIWHKRNKSEQSKTESEEVWVKSLDWEHLTAAPSPRHTHELRTVGGHCWGCWCQQNAISLEAWDRWQYNKAGIWKLLSPLYCLALSSLSVLMVLLFNCWQWQNIMCGTPDYFMERETFHVMKCDTLCFLKFLSLYRVNVYKALSSLYHMFCKSYVSHHFWRYSLMTLSMTCYSMYSVFIETHLDTS